MLFRSPGDDPFGIGDGHAGAHLSQIQGNDPPTSVFGRWQRLLLGSGEPPAQDLAHFVEGFGDGL